jgi:hypothetical protein
MKEMESVDSTHSKLILRLKEMIKSTKEELTKISHPDQFDYANIMNYSTKTDIYSAIKTYYEIENVIFDRIIDNMTFLELENQNPMIYDNELLFDVEHMIESDENELQSLLNPHHSHRPIAT